MKAKIRQKLARGKRQSQKRLANFRHGAGAGRVFGGQNIHYEIAERTQGIAYGGLGAIQALVKKLSLAEAIDNKLHLLKIHAPYHESDHVLNIAYNVFCDGQCLQDMDDRRTDVNFLNAIGANTSPDPTTAGDFCRRFGPDDVYTLIDVYHDTRLQVWAEQPADFFTRAIIDTDGSIVGTTGECKQGMDIAYNGTWGYHPLLVSLANTGETLSIINRPGSRPSHEGAAVEINKCVEVCFRGGFQKVLLRGDTDFSQTAYLDGWNSDGRIQFIFGYDSMPNLRALASDLPAAAWQKLERPPHYQVKTEPRERPENVKQRIVTEREFEDLRLVGEEVAEFRYRPTACAQDYRMIVVKKDIEVHRGQQTMFEHDTRFFFYITNDWDTPAADIVYLANDRCDQENLLAQLKGAVRALHAPVNTLEANWAYMVMAALAWNLKAWLALSLPEEAGRWQEPHRQEKRWLLKMEFRTFVTRFVRLPCQIVRTGRRLIYRLLSWNPYQETFFRMWWSLRC